MTMKEKPQTDEFNRLLDEYIVSIYQKRITTARATLVAYVEEIVRERDEAQKMVLQLRGKF